MAEQVGAALLQVLPALGNRWLPRTNNAAERYFRAFSRFARARNGFGSSAHERIQEIEGCYLAVPEPGDLAAKLQMVHAGSRRTEI